MEVRTEMQRWGLPKDEFADTGHFPHQMYVREARRMISDYVVTEHDAYARSVADDSVALASYPLDSHGVTLYVDENGVLHRERGFFVGGTKPFPISYRALRPRAAECGNLLVLSCLSASHAAYGSVRMEPVFMMLGHAAGAAASLAVEQKVTIQNVPYAALRERLLAEKQILDRNSPRPVYASKPGATTETAAPMAPDARLAADVKVLVEKEILDSADYWLAHARKGVSCDGEKVAGLFVKMARNFKPVSDVSEAIPVLIDKRLFSSRDYWVPRTVPGGRCSGDLVAGIMRKFMATTEKN